MVSIGIPTCIMCSGIIFENIILVAIGLTVLFISMIILKTLEVKYSK